MCLLILTASIHVSSWLDSGGVTPVDVYSKLRPCSRSWLWIFQCLIIDCTNFWVLAIDCLTFDPLSVSCMLWMQAATWLQGLGHTGVTPTCSETISELKSQTLTGRVMRHSMDVTGSWFTVFALIYGTFQLLEHKILIRSNSWRNEWIFEVKTTRMGKIYFFLLYIR